jgi:hypothetical protein
VSRSPLPSALPDLSSDRMRGKPAGPLQCLLILVAVLAVVFSKAPGALELPQFWAEDALVFFAQARELGLASVVTPYAQYLHLLPRLVALAATPLPAAHAPAFYAWSAFILSSLALAWFICRLRGHDTRLMALLASALCLTNGEIYGTLTNVQWLLQLYLLSACLEARPQQDRLPSWVHPLLIGLVSLTGPFSVITALMLIPWALLGLLPLRWNVGKALAAHVHQLSPARILALLAGAAVQLGVLLGSERKPAHQSLATSLEQLPAILQIHTLGMEQVAGTLAMACMVALVALLLRALARPGADNPDRILLGFMLVFGLVQTVGGMTKMGIPMDVGGGDRYLYAFKLAFWTSLPLIATRAGLLRVLLWLLTATGLCLVAYTNPQWLARKPLADLRWAEYAAAIDRNEPVTVPVHPQPWVMTLPRYGTGTTRPAEASP